MIYLKIDNKEIEVTEGTTVMEAARQAGISIPSMCHLKGYGNHPSCMICLVKDIKTGALVPSCALKATNGMEYSASDEDVMVARRQSLELLMSDHVGDCEAPCSLACPAGMNIPQMNRLIGEGKFTEALRVVKEEIALPFVLGYICPAPCEKACRRKNMDEAVSVCLLKRFSAASGTDENASPKISSGKKVAIIGSGPAGLAAAYYLQNYGHACSVFDKSPEPGGTLRTSISDDLLPKNVIDQEVEIIRSMGATFHFNALVTELVFNTEIKNNFDAVVFATGDIATENYLSALLPLTKTGYQVNENDMSTALAGVFVCGSAIRPNKMAVRSVAQGKTVADSVHLFLHGQQFEKPGKIFNSRFDKILPAEFGEYLKEASADKRFNPVDLLTGFSEKDAVSEARRCLHCDCRKQDDCKLRTYAHAYNIERKRYLVEDRRLITKQVQHDKIVYEQEKCIKCGICVEVSASAGEKYGLAFEGRGFDVVINTPLGVGFKDGLSDVAIKCANSCPTGALSIRENNFKVIRE